MNDLERNLIEAVREWYSVGLDADTAGIEDAARALFAPPPAVNTPDVPNATPRPWASIPAGWFIQDPKGAWWEILETARVDTGQRVAMRCGSMRGEWIRPLEQRVLAAPGTLAPEIQGAVDAFGSAFHVDVLGDQVS